MTFLTCTLLSDGSSDRALLPVLQWLLRQHSQRDFQPQWADLRRLRRPPRLLPQRIQVTLQLYPCDLLFVHRDAEGGDRAERVEEIRRCLAELEDQTVVCVVPVRMQEAWFLFDEHALRRAAGNPGGRVPLTLPLFDRLESVPDPKGVLFDLLRVASDLRPGRQHRFDPAARLHRLAELIEVFSPLRRLSAFEALEEEVKAVLAGRDWV